jgi:hypothetical protein
VLFPITSKYEIASEFISCCLRQLLRKLSYSGLRGAFPGPIRPTAFRIAAVMQLQWLQVTSRPAVSGAILYSGATVRSTAKLPFDRFTIGCCSIESTLVMRKLVWREESGLLSCSDCGWVFRPTSTPVGKTPEEIAHDFALQRDEAFAAHVCADHRTRRNHPRRR